MKQIKNAIAILLIIQLFDSCTSSEDTKSNQPQPLSTSLENTEKTNIKTDTIDKVDSNNSAIPITSIFTDNRDGKKYRTVKLGTQTWMAENLAYKSTEGCWAYKNDQNNVKVYGYMYNWETAKRACPSGWHLPSDAEWTILSDYLGGADVAGQKMKNTNGWIKNGNGNNSSRFSGLPGGYHMDGDDNFRTMGYYGHFWSSTEDDVWAWARYLDYNKTELIRNKDIKLNVYSCRCVLD
jgi:uncharacterized protein (TIGR02145 family)